MIRAGEAERSRMEIGGPRTEPGDTGGLVRSIQSGGNVRIIQCDERGEENILKEVVAISFLVAAVDETTPAEVEEDSPVEVEVEEAVGDEVEDSLEEVGDVADVVEVSVSEADLRREGRTGDVETVASVTFLTGWNATSVRPPSQMSLSLHRPTPWRTPGMRSS